jgi:hypothetical protein
LIGSIALGVAAGVISELELPSAFIALASGLVSGFGIALGVLLRRVLGKHKAA